ncbi:hypothetical protein AX15_000580 [Amanita polypyramis BW_CC]|nr:hypothetical protein AX15_000580 [Amanita polypyramis BW_CC]
MTPSPNQQLPPSTIPIITTIAAFREWRKKAFQAGQSVGYVATMGALHQGHISLVKRSLADNDHTVVSIFVNPAQFAPHEDLAVYPRTLPRDVELIGAESIDVPGQPRPRTPSVVFVPSVQEMYPSGITQDVGAQKGTFVQVKGYDHQMEGKSRPTFFRGVATVVIKLFNIIQPTNTYFGQKDIQQALILRRLCRDLLLDHPDPKHLHIVPIVRDATDGLALSSRNAYLSAEGRRFAPTLYEALHLAEQAWNQGRTKGDSIKEAIKLIQSRSEEAGKTPEHVEVKLDYVEMNDEDTFDELEESRTISEGEGDAQIILSGALWVGRTRLIDNILLRR